MVPLLLLLGLASDFHGSIVNYVLLKIGEKVFTKNIGRVVLLMIFSFIAVQTTFITNVIKNIIGLTFTGRS
jgi:hypothetical protein